MIGIIFEVFVWIIEISLVLVAIFFHWVEERNRPPAITGERDGDEVHVGGGAGSVDALLYRLHDLEIATNYFSDDNKLGKGGFGVVYKGLLDGQTVAVKKLYGSSVELDFLNEVSLLSSLKHNNLIKLLGFCCEARNFILVYEYALNGDLYHYLIDENKRQTLNWEMRLEIIKGFARGLSYLHHDSKNPILHRDIKPANVLLDEHHCAKIADFDLLRAFDTDETHKTTKQVAGTRGYIAPELFFECHVSTRSDVYSYGILVLETLAGCTVQKYAAANSGDVLSHVVWKQWKEKKPLTEVIDSYLRDTCPQDQLMSCITIGLLCVQEDPRKRPNMKLVLKMLNNESPLPAPSSPAFYKGITLNPSTGSGSGSDDPLCPEGQSPNLRVFTFAELRSATKNFSPDTVLGEGGAGRIYKGWVDEKTLNPVRSGAGLVIAVKKLNPESLLGLIEWQLEVHFLGRLSHPNLVRLLGYCWEDKNLFLVYEFVPKGSLANHLFRRGTNEPLSWDLRIKIATGAARALTFLHTSERQVIHRDFKSSHILLDSNYNAKLCDFCLAKLGPTGSDSYVSTRVMGTYGCAAPEYIATGHLSVKSDVYGFGVVLLEMLSGQRVIDRNRPSDQQSLVDWAKPLLSGRHKLVRLMDPELEGEYPLKAALEATDLALKCVASEPKNRPSMKEVVEKLEHIEAMKGATSSRDVKKAAKKDWLCVFN